MSAETITTAAQYDVWEEYNSRKQNLHNAFVDGVVNDEQYDELMEMLDFKYETLFDLASL